MAGKERGQEREVRGCEEMDYEKGRLRSPVT